MGKNNEQYKHERVLHKFGIRVDWNVKGYDIVTKNDVELHNAIQYITQNKGYFKPIGASSSSDTESVSSVSKESL